MYWRLTRFLLPLIITIIVHEFGIQFINAGMARMPRATETLAAFGLAYGLVLFLASPLAQARQMSLVLVDNRPSFRKGVTFVLGMSLVLMIFQTSLVVTPLGNWIIDDLHRVEPTLSELVRTVLLWMVPVPLLHNSALFLTGLLIRARRTEVISYATVGSISCGIATVFVLLPLEAIRAQPIWLPILATYAMTIAEFVIIYWGFRRYIVLPDQSDLVTPRPPLTYRYLLQFFWPLALVMFVQELSRPLINLFIARGPDGTVALAVLSITYALGQWPYRWLNEIRNLPPAFHNEDRDLRRVRRFAAVAGILSFAISVTLFWTPLRDLILLRLVGVDAELAQRSHVPLMLYSFFAFVVALRAYLHGVGLLERRTQAFALSAPSRISAILILMIGLPFLGITGATLGVAALLGGFTAETIALWWGVRGQAIFAARAHARALPVTPGSD
ncbi:MAG: hypothetical protein KF893_21455 [Caldilineaceae bacterium]|nr:hypothetical protein [Caldilineaceae bacterium]